MAQSEYVFHRVEDQRELERLRMIEWVFDPASRRRLLGIGLQAGWRCLEVGPGAGSIMTWMSEVVGPAGQVLAVDLDPKFLSEAERPNVTVVRADISTAQLPQQSFDVVHARYVLIHLPDYEVALTKMFDSLKPGDWLVLEEPDFSASRGITGDEQELASLRKINQAIEQMYATLRMDYALGLKLPALMQRRGLQHLTVENDAPLCAGGGRPGYGDEDVGRAIAGKVFGHRSGWTVRSQTILPICRRSAHLGHLLRHNRREGSEGREIRCP